MLYIAIILASILHGITGMGFPMIGTVALSLHMPLSHAIVMLAIPCAMMSLLVYYWVKPKTQKLTLLAFNFI